MKKFKKVPTIDNRKPIGRIILTKLPPDYVIHTGPEGKRLIEQAVDDQIKFLMK